VRQVFGLKHIAPRLRCRRQGQAVVDIESKALGQIERQFMRLEVYRPDAADSPNSGENVSDFGIVIASLRVATETNSFKT
jgi:hypothetical protein